MMKQVRFDFIFNMIRCSTSICAGHGDADGGGTGYGDGCGNAYGDGCGGYSDSGGDHYTNRDGGGVGGTDSGVGGTDSGVASSTFSFANLLLAGMRS